MKSRDYLVIYLHDQGVIQSVDYTLAGAYGKHI